MKERSHLFRGAMSGTLLRGDALRFIRLGTLMERSDGTARLLSVNQQLLEQHPDTVREYYCLDMLRAVSAREAYNAIFKQQLMPPLVNEMLILRSESPRSLHSCIEEIASQLEQIGSSGEDRPRYLSTVLLAEMRFSTGKADARRPAAVAGPFSQPHQRAGGEHQSHLSGGEMRLNIEHKTGTPMSSR